MFYFLFISDSKILFSYNLTILDVSACKIIIFARRSIRQISSWIEVLITFDRLIYINFSARFKLNQNKIFLLEIIALIIIILCVIGIENFFYYIKANQTVISLDANYTQNITRLDLACTASKDILLASDLVAIILRTFLPITLMVILNVILVKSVISVKSKMVISNSNNKSTRNQLQFTFVVIAMDAYFLILNLPVSVIYILRNVIDSNSCSGLVVDFLTKLFLMYPIYTMLLCFFSTSFLENKF